MTLQERILSFLEEQYEPVTTPQIAEECQGHRSRVLAVLRLAERRGKVVQVGLTRSHQVGCGRPAILWVAA